MMQRPNSTGEIISINGSLLTAAALATTAWFTWPSEPEWWGFGFISILCGGAAVGKLIAAIREMTRLYLRDRALAAFMKKGAKPQSSKLASSDALRQAGMLDE